MPTETNSQNLNAQQMGQLAEQQMKDRVTAESMGNPNVVAQGAQMGSIQTGTEMKPVTFQALTQNAPGLDYTMKTGVVTGTPARAYATGLENKVKTKEEELLDLENKAKQDTLTPIKAGDKNIEYATKYGGMAFDAPIAPSGFGAQVESVREVTEPAREAMNEAQAEALATQRTGAYRMGQAGTDYAKSAMAKLEKDQARVQADFARQERDLLRQAWKSALTGNVQSAEQFRQEAAVASKERADAQKAALEMQKQALEIEQIAEERIDKTTDRMIQTGYEPTDDQLEYMDAKYGLETGMSRTFFEASRIDYNIANAKTRQEQFKSAVEGASALQGLLEKVPIGTEITIGGISYSGLSRGAIKTGTETDSNGNVRFWEFNQDTGESRTTSLGNIGKAEDGWETKFDDDGNPWRFNAKTNQMVPYGASVTQQEWQQVFPEGSTSPFVDARGNPRVQCGAFVNDLCGAGVGDSWESKMAKTDASIKPDSANPPRTGDFFVQKLGTWTGHVGMIADEKTDPRTGEKLYLALESNYPQPEKVTNSRWIKASDIDGYGRTGTLHPVLMTGPDARGAGSDAGAGVAGGAPSNVRLGAGTYAPTFGKKVSEAEKPQRFNVDGRIVEISPQGQAREIYVAPNGDTASKPLSVEEVMKINETLPPEQRIGLNTPRSDIPDTIKPTFGAKESKESAMSPTDIEKSLGRYPDVDASDPRLIGATPTQFRAIVEEYTGRKFEEFADTYRAENTQSLEQGVAGPVRIPSDREIAIAYDEEKKKSKDGGNKFTKEFYSTEEGQKVRDDETQARQFFEKHPIVAEFVNVQNKAASIESIIKSGVGGPADLALVFEFMKALDPNSVVREAEYDNAAKSGNIFKGAFAKYNGYLKETGGFLPETVHKGFMELANNKLEIKRREYEKYKEETRKIVERQGLNPDNVVVDFTVEPAGTTADATIRSAPNKSIVQLPNGKKAWKVDEKTFEVAYPVAELKTVPIGSLIYLEGEARVKHGQVVRKTGKDSFEKVQ